LNVLVREDTFRRFGAMVVDRFPDVRFVVLDDEHALWAADRAAGDLDFEVAWGSQGIFLDHAPGAFLERLEQSSDLAWFQSPGAGNDQPIIGSLLSRGVLVTGTHVHSISIAEAVLRGVLDRFQDAAAWRAAQQRGAWAPHWFREVYGSRWLIIGVGSIGSDVARRARAFGATVTGVRRSPTGEEPVDRMISPEEVISVLPEHDVVVLAASGNPSTRKLVDRGFLARMQDDALLVNPSRGSLVDEDALLEALDAGAIGGAILDSFATQPLPAGHRLWSHPLVDVTPHSTARGSGRAERSARVFLENLERYRNREPLLDAVAGGVS
jgi:phosphoglycerate dehydrogenase-like enzyme